MRINIDVDSSIKKKRLVVTHKNFGTRLNSWFSIFYTVALIFIGIIFPLLMINKYQNHSIYTKNILLFSPFIFIGFLSLYSLIYDNRLFKLEGVNEEINRQIISSILEERFNVAIHRNKSNILRVYKKATLWKFGLRIIVIFENNNVFLNISHFNLKALKSPFHSWFDSFKIKSIIKEFKLKASTISTYSLQKI